MAVLTVQPVTEEGAVTYSNETSVTVAAIK
jgi:hypothetical protein